VHVTSRNVSYATASVTFNTFQYKRFIDDMYAEETRRAYAV